MSSSRLCEQCHGTLDHLHPARVAKARFCDAACRRAWHREHAADQALDGRGRGSGAQPLTTAKATRGGPRTTRMRKAWCPGCGCIVRLSRKWIRAGLPTCVNCGRAFVCADEDQS